MAVKFERIVAQDINFGTGQATVTMPGGGSATGDQVNLASFPDAWTTPTFAAGDYTMNTGTWTVDAADRLLQRYIIIGKTMLLAFNVQTTTISAGAGAELRIKIPGDKKAVNKEFTGLVLITGADNGPALGYCVTRDAGSGGEDKIAIFKASAAAWAQSTNNTGIRGFIAFEIQ